MPADQSKTSITDAKVEPDPRPPLWPLWPEDRTFKEEDEATDLAFQIACEDPTGKDHLASSVSRARKRLEAALCELARATLALLFAYIASLFLDLAYRKITDTRGEVGRSERRVLALQKMLESFTICGIIGRWRLLRALGASWRPGDPESIYIYSLALAERRYRHREGMCGLGHAAAADSPTVRVVLGIRIAGSTRRSEPVWCLKRFAENGIGGWTQTLLWLRARRREQPGRLLLRSPANSSARPTRRARHCGARLPRDRG